MGGVVSAVVGVLPGVGLAIAILAQLASLFRPGSIGSNPTIRAIEDAARRMAQEAIDGARMAQEEAERAASNAVESEWEARAAQEDAEREAREAREQEREARVAQAEAEMTTREAEERQREARDAQEEAENAARAAEEKANEAKAAQEEAERKWKEGIQPEVWPTAKELAAAKKRHQYTEGLLHFAIAGIAGSGKSSLINAVRGYRNNDPGAAAVGVTETTTAISRYPDPIHPFVWYDIPGAGTLTIPDWEYFNKQGLYIFDCIIVLLGDRFTATDIAILKNCARFKIPSYIVRSKSNQHIRNIMEDMGYTSDDGYDRRDELSTIARDKFIMETRKSVQTNLEKAKLPHQRVYIVAKDIVFGVIKGKVQKGMIDEVELIQILLSDARDRRLTTSPRSPQRSRWNTSTIAPRSTYA